MSNASFLVEVGIPTLELFEDCNAHLMGQKRSLAVRGLWPAWSFAVRRMVLEARQESVLSGSDGMAGALSLDSSLGGAEVALQVCSLLAVTAGSRTIMVG